MKDLRTPWRMGDVTMDQFGDGPGYSAAILDVRGDVVCDVWDEDRGECERSAAVLLEAVNRPPARRRVSLGCRGGLQVAVDPDDVSTVRDLAFVSCVGRVEIVMRSGATFDVSEPYESAVAKLYPELVEGE